MYRLGLIEKKCYQYRSADMAKEIKRMQFLQEQYLFICKNDISSVTDLMRLHDEAKQTFGSSNVPALPPEAKGYNSVYLEIETLNNDVFTIRRDFNDKNNAYWIYSKFEDINDDTSFEKIKAESKTDKNISEKILSICGCNYKNLLKKTSTGETKKFTFRDFVPLIMVNEGRITQKYSPVHRTSPRGNTLAVSEWTAFQTIITGEDYIKTSKAESADVIKSRIKGQIQELELLCAELKTEIEELKEAVEGTSVDELDKRIEELQTVIDEKKEYLLSKEEEYCLLIKRLKEADYEKQRISDNRNIFTGWNGKRNISRGKRFIENPIKAKKSDIS